MGVVTNPEIQRGLFNHKRNQDSVGEKRAVVGLDWFVLRPALCHLDFINTEKMFCQLH